MRCNDMNEHEAYCLQFLRSHAYELYFSVLFAPADKRGALSALYAFQTEILRISAQVTEPILGEMRLKWWQENLSAAIVNGSVSKNQNPVIMALAMAAKQHSLPLNALLHLCDAARFDLYCDPMADYVEFTKYCRNIYGIILELSCHILAGKSVNANETACREGGIAQALMAIMRTLPQRLQQNKFVLPVDVMSAIGADREIFALAIKEIQLLQNNFSKQESTDKLVREQGERIIRVLLAFFWEHYIAFAQAEKNAQHSCRPAFLPAAVLSAYAKRIEKKQENIFITAPKISLISIQTKIIAAALFDRFSTK